MATAAKTTVLTVTTQVLSHKQREAEAAILRWVSEFFTHESLRLSHAIAARYREIYKSDSPDDSERAAEAIIDYVGYDSWSSVADYIWEPISEIAGEAGSKTLYELSIDDRDIFNLVSADAVDFAHERAAELVGKKWIDGELIDNPDARWSITDTTRLRLRDAVAEAIETGEGWQQLEQAILDSTAFDRERAEMIARTETAIGHMNGALIAAKASGLALMKEWKLGTEHPLDDECDDNADAGDVQLDDDFPSGVQCPPDHPHCTCHMSFVTEEQ